MADMDNKAVKEVSDYVSRKKLVINGEGHLKGRLASVVAKALLLGRVVVVYNCDKICITGKFKRSKLKWFKFWNQRCNVNPARGPFHYRAPKAIFYRCVRGMVPRKTLRGRKAIRNLKVYEGIPPKYAKTTSLVVPCAMRVLNCRPDYKWHTIGKLSSDVGWKYGPVINKLNRKREEKERIALKKKLKIKHLKYISRVQTRRDTFKLEKKVRKCINQAHFKTFDKGYTLKPAAKPKTKTAKTKASKAVPKVAVK